jgi:hypothetical protein
MKFSAKMESRNNILSSLREFIVRTVDLNIYGAIWLLRKLFVA